MHPEAWDVSCPTGPNSSPRPAARTGHPVSASDPRATHSAVTSVVSAEDSKQWPGEEREPSRARPAPAPFLCGKELHLEGVLLRAPSCWEQTGFPLPLSGAKDKRSGEWPSRPLFLCGSHTYLLAQGKS